MEAKIEKAMFQFGELSVRSDLNNRVHVERSAPGRCGWIGDQQGGDATANESDIGEQGSQSLRCDVESGEIRIGWRRAHFESIRALNSRMANSRSRARPSRIAS